MDSIDSPSSGAGFDGAESTHRELQSLRLTVQITLAALVIFTGSVGIMIFRQVSLLRRQTDATRRQAQHVSQIFESTIGPQAQAFEKQLREFAETDPEFKARIARFYGPPDAAQPAKAPSATAETQGASPQPPLNP